MNVGGKDECANILYTESYWKGSVYLSLAPEAVILQTQQNVTKLWPFPLIGFASWYSFINAIALIPARENLLTFFLV